MKLLFESSRYYSCRSVAIVGGIGPENQFDLTLRYVRFGAIFGINSRIGPESLFHDTSRNVRLGHSRMNWGKLPLTPMLYMEKICRVGIGEKSGLSKLL